MVGGSFSIEKSTPKALSAANAIPGCLQKTVMVNNGYFREFETFFAIGLDKVVRCV
jgi:hypothetical protein